MTPPGPVATDVNDTKWKRVMITYSEQDFPTSEAYDRTVPGWQCVRCGMKYGTSGGPPGRCWAKDGCNE